MSNEQLQNLPGALAKAALLPDYWSTSRLLSTSAPRHCPQGSEHTQAPGERLAKPRDRGCHEVMPRQVRVNGLYGSPAVCHLAAHKNRQGSLKTYPTLEQLKLHLWGGSQASVEKLPR